MHIRSLGFIDQIETAVAPEPQDTAPRETADQYNSYVDGVIAEFDAQAAGPGDPTPSNFRFNNLTVTSFTNFANAHKGPLVAAAAAVTLLAVFSGQSSTPRRRK